MEENRYLISETAKKVGVETHVLRYWEVELDLPIHRNELGHRYYTQQDVSYFIEVKRLKEKGLQLKAIKTVLEKPEDKDYERTYERSHDKTYERLNGKPDEAVSKTKEVSTMESSPKNEKALRLQMLLKFMITEAVRESGSEMVEQIKDSVVKELDYQFRLHEEEEEKREENRQSREEEHYRKLDELIRTTVEKKGKRKKHSIF